MPKPFVNLDEVEFDDSEENGYYTSKSARFSAATRPCRAARCATTSSPATGKSRCSALMTSCWLPVPVPQLARDRTPCLPVDQDGPRGKRVAAPSMALASWAAPKRMVVSSRFGSEAGAQQADQHSRNRTFGSNCPTDTMKDWPEWRETKSRYEGGFPTSFRMENGNVYDPDGSAMRGYGNRR